VQGPLIEILQYAFGPFEACKLAARKLAGSVPACLPLASSSACGPDARKLVRLRTRCSQARRFGARMLAARKLAT